MHDDYQAEPVESKAAALSELSQHWQAFGNLEHDLLNIYETDPSVHARSAEPLTTRGLTGSR